MTGFARAVIRNLKYELRLDTILRFTELLVEVVPVVSVVTVVHEERLKRLISCHCPLYPAGLTHRYQKPALIDLSNLIDFPDYRNFGLHIHHQLFNPNLSIKQQSY